MTKIRLLVSGALVAGSLFVTAAPASATCRPERPDTCETEWPDIQEIGDVSCVGYVALPTGTVTVDLCDPTSYIPQ